MHRHHHGEIDTATFGHDADKHDPNKGPTFMLYLTPRNGHEPAYPEHFSLGDVQSAAKGDNNLRGSDRNKNMNVRGLRTSLIRILPR